jgi:two-component system, NtrC family, sensor kinase
MPRPALRLHHRIVIPVVLAALVTTSFGAYVSLTLTRRALETRMVTQLAGAAAAVSRGDFAVNGAVLARVKEIVGADILTYSLRGEVLASTATGARRAELFATVSADQSIASASPDRPIVKRTTCGAVPCYIAYTRVPTATDTIVAVVEEASELNAATQAMQRTILVSAALGALVLMLVSQLVAARVTRPLARLVAFTRNVEDGSTERMAAAGNDEIGTLAAAFNDMLDRLDHARQAVVRSEKLALAGLLAARVAHDIRNPLSSLKMQAQLLRSRVPTNEGQAMLAAVLHDVDQVESVVRGLLELAKPGEVNARPTRLEDVVRDVLEHLRLQLTHSRIAVSEDLSAVSPLIPLDAQRFKPALLNVIVNALEAMPSGGTLTVTTKAADDRASVSLVVCDDGIGVDPAILDNVFDPFVSSKREGVGLGLVNTKSIVERHGGSVHLAPRSPRGTCVTISLPASPGTPTSSDPMSHG